MSSSFRLESCQSEPMRPHSQSPSGPQTGTFSYFRFNPEVHNHEKPFEILINLPKIDKNGSKFRRTNLEFEDQQVVIDDVRGHEDDFTLDRNGACWRKWEGPAEWVGMDADTLRNKGSQWVEDVYAKQVEKFIKEELEKQDGKPVDFVKVFDYRLRSSTDIKDFTNRTLDLSDGLDRIVPVTQPHVDQSAEGAVLRVRKHMGEDAEKLLSRRYRIVKQVIHQAKLEYYAANIDLAQHLETVQDCYQLALGYL